MQDHGTRDRIPKSKTFQISTSFTCSNTQLIFRLFLIFSAAQERRCLTSGTSMEKATPDYDNSSTPAGGRYTSRQLQKSTKSSSKNSHNPVPMWSSISGSEARLSMYVFCKVDILNTDLNTGPSHPRAENSPRDTPRQYPREPHRDLQRLRAHPIRALRHRARARFSDRPPHNTRRQLLQIRLFCTSTYNRRRRAASVLQSVCFQRPE